MTTSSNKTILYDSVFDELQSVIDDKLGAMGRMATIVAVLHQRFDYFDWTGFYITSKNNLLEIGPYQGSLACLYIPFGKGVCGFAANEKKSVVVENVHKFPGHIACDSRSQSEIVIPIVKDNQVIAVLDVDSHRLAAFDQIDQIGLEKIITLL